MIVPEPILVDPHREDLATDIDELPQGSGVYAIHLNGVVPHLGSCAYLRARIKRLVGISAEANKRRLLDQLIRIECWPTGSRLETSLLLLGLAQRWFPEDYAKKLRLRRPWLTGISSDRFPRLHVIQKLEETGGAVYGPFPSRDTAVAYSEAVSGLFQIRKCPDPLYPSPDHPGCIYGEMNQCMRPCQCAVSDDEYRSEAARVIEFLRTNGASAKSSVLLARERASEELDFEMAAQMHKRLERLSSAAALREDPIADIRGFGGVAVTRSILPGVLCLWPMRDAAWVPKIDVDLHEMTAESRSLDASLRDALASAWTSEQEGDPDRSAHLAVFLRWYRSSYRDGEWLPDIPGKGISYRKLTGCVSRLMKTP